MTVQELQEFANELIEVARAVIQCWRMKVIHM